jgi:hypothetical protein
VACHLRLVLLRGSVALRAQSRTLVVFLVVPLVALSLTVFSIAWITVAVDLLIFNPSIMLHMSAKNAEHH